MGSGGGEVSAGVVGLSSAAPMSGAGVKGEELESSKRAHPASNTAVIDMATTAAVAVRGNAPTGFMVRTLRQQRYRLATRP